MIQNIEKYKQKEFKERKLMLKKLSIKKAVKILENLLRTKHAFPNQERPQPISLAKLIHSKR